MDQCEALRMIIDIIKTYGDTDKRKAALLFIQSAGLTPNILTSYRKIEADALDPDFDYLQCIDEILDMIAV